MKAGRALWLEKLKSAGKPVPYARRAERRQDRKQFAYDAKRFERFRAGGPFWTDEEWEAL